MGRNDELDFAKLNAIVNIQTVLRHYGIDWLRKVGRDLRGRCPIHQGNRPDSFSVNLDRNVFHCFSCQASGGVLNLVASMENCSIREAALKLNETLVFQEASVNAAQPKTPSRCRSERDGCLVNRPLDFELRGVDRGHPYLAFRDICLETATVFGVGYYGGAGIMTGRVVIPMHNATGQLVAYAGRSIDGREPRYRVPFGFHKSLELFNAHRVT